jgi:hypothetical protein
MTRNELLDVAHAAHANGARRHPRYWLAANHLAVNVLHQLNQKPHDPVMKAVASVLTLRLLDWLQPLGVIEEPTDENVKGVLERLKEKSVTEG